MLILLAAVFGDAKVMASFARKGSLEQSRGAYDIVSSKTIRERFTIFIELDEKYIEATEEHQHNQILSPFIKWKRDSEPIRVRMPSPALQSLLICL